jgi:hypothetical protein
MIKKEIAKEVVKEVPPERMAELWLDSIDIIGTILLFDVALPFSVTQRISQLISAHSKLFRGLSPKLQEILGGTTEIGGSTKCH